MTEGLFWGKRNEKSFLKSNGLVWQVEGWSAQPNAQLKNTGSEIKYYFAGLNNILDAVEKINIFKPI